MPLAGAAALGAVALGAVAMGCHTAAAPHPAEEARPPQPTTGDTWRYDVAIDARRELTVEARISLPPGALVGVESAGRFLEGVVVETPLGVVPLRAERDAQGDPAFRMPACPRGECTLRYRFELADAAREVSEIGCAEEEAGTILTSPSAWLLHPREPESGQRFELRVATPPGTSFVAGILPLGVSALPPEAYAADVSDLPNPAWAAVGPLRLERLKIGDEAIDVAIARGTFEVGDAAVRAWVTASAKAVESFYGRPSIARALIVIVPRARGGIGFARTLGNGGATIIANVGERTSEADFAASWELLHELLHVSFPTLGGEHAWLSEGMATYVEPLVRARLGRISAEEAFARFVERMPFGVPQPGDQGLDRTHTWGRTYWGGALFWLLADVAIRSRTEGRRSLDDALRAVLAAGGNVAERWSVEQIIAAGDGATGVPVLRELYDEMATRPAPVDLDDLWRRLGVVKSGATAAFDDRAPLAAIRKALVARREAP